MDNKLCIITYSHTNCKDLWKPYFDRLDKHANQLPSFWLCNEDINDFGRHYCFKYDNNEPYSNQWLHVLEFLKANGYEYFIYSQEDFILYSDIDINAIHTAIEEINSNKTGFVKLIKSGGTEYCMQAAVHSIDKFISFYEKYQIDSIRQEGFLSQCSIGEYESKFLPKEWVGDKRGLFHYDSNVWPYIATAINKGKWNVSEYGKELTLLQQEYNIDFSDRGTL
jgi:hypothetical protein